MTYAEATAALRTHYDVTGSRDLAEAELRLAHLDGFFSGDRLAAITTAQCETYAGKRQGEGPRTVPLTASWPCSGRCCASLMSMTGSRACPRSARIRKLAEAAPRAGFVELAQFEGIRCRLPVDLQAAVTIAFTYGWRRDEILTLQRRQLDLAAGTLCSIPAPRRTTTGGKWT